jgi:LacI family transcriptional regulator
LGRWFLCLLLKKSLITRLARNALTQYIVPRMKLPLTIDAIARASGVSRATVDRVINGRSKVSPRTREHVLKAIETLQGEGGPTEPTSLAGRGRPTDLQRVGLIIQASPPFTQAVLEEVERCTANKGLSRLRCAISGHVSHSDQDTLRLIQELEPRVDALAIHCKNTPDNLEALRRIGQNGKPVVTLAMDLDPVVRAGYVGVDNRRAGQIAAFIAGRTLERVEGAEVAVMVGFYSYRGHEDLEIGFRTTLREYFPQVELVEVIKGEDSSEPAYAATRELLERRPAIAGIYNVAGGNQGVANALREARLPKRPFYIAHEVNAETERLIRQRQIDYLLTQDLDQLVLQLGEVLLEVKTAGGSTNPTRLLPIRVFTPPHFP